MLKLGRRYLDLGALLPSIVFPLVLLVGASYSSGNSLDAVRVWVRETPLAMTVLLILGGVLVYVVVAACFRALDRFVPSERSSSDERRVFLLAFVLLGVPWLCWWAVHYPGALDDDTVYQMLQSSGFQSWSNHHPVFDTWLFGRIWALGDVLGSKSRGLAVFSLLNTLASAAAVGLSVAFMHRHGVHRNVLRIVVLFLALVPIIPMYAMSMTKDYLFSWIFLVFSVLFSETVLSRGEALKSRWMSSGVVVVACLAMLTKQTGLYCVVVALIVVLAVSRGRRLMAGTVFGVPVLLILLFTNVVLPGLGVRDTETKEMLSIPVQQTARYVATYPNELTDEEKQAIEGVLPLDELAQVYNPRRSDNVKDRWKAEASSEQVSAYFVTWFRMGLKHPGVYVGSLVNNTYGFFYPEPMDDLYDEVDEGLFSPSRMEYWYGLVDHSKFTLEDVETELSGIEASARLTPLRDWVNANYHALRHHPLTQLPLSGAFYCFWVPLVAMSYVLSRRQWMGALILAPYLVFFLTLIAGPIALPRYMAAPIFLFPWVLSVFFVRRGEVSKTSARRGVPEPVA